MVKGCQYRVYTVHVYDIQRYNWVVIYLLTHCDGGSLPVIGIMKVKRKEDFNDKAICQTIGHHVASRAVNTLQDEPTNIIPPLLVIICQDRLRFIFLPFISGTHHYIDVVASFA